MKYLILYKLPFLYRAFRSSSAALLLHRLANGCKSEAACFNFGWDGVTT